MKTHLVIATLLASGMVLAGASGEYREQLLQRFEEGPGGWTGGTVVQEHATEGENAYQVLIRRGAPGQTFGWNGNLDLSGWFKLKFDTYNDGDPFNVSLVATDADGRSYRSWYQSVLPGRSRLEYNLRGFTSGIPDNSGEAAVSLDLSRISSLQFIVDTDIPVGRRVTIDNMRASVGPEPRDPPGTWGGGGVPAEEVPGNLIVNGNFANSLQAWGFWGQWDGGEYTVSTGEGDNAHTGSLSMAIHCIRVGRGGTSQAVEIPRAGTYRLRFAHKGDGADAMRLWMNEPAHTEDVPVTGEWGIYERDFELPQGEVLVYLMHTSAGTLYIDSVSLVALDGEAEEQREQRDLPRRSVTIEGERTFVDGEPFFPIGFYGVNHPRELEGSGANFMIGTGRGQEYVTDLDACYDADVMTILALTGVLRGHRPEAAVPAVADKMDHPAVFGFYLCDEPDHPRVNVPPAIVRAAHHALKEVSEKPTISLVMAWHRSMTYQYADTADIIANDPYHLTDHHYIVRATRWMADALPEPQPKWSVLIAGFEGMDQLRVDDPKIIPLQAYAAIAHGANGIIWAELKGIIDPQIREAFFEVSRELRHLHDVLAAPTAAEQASAGDPRIATILKDGPDGPVLITVNQSAEVVGEVELRLPASIDAESATVVFEEREVAIRDGAIEDRFGPGQRHVYRLGH